MRPSHTYVPHTRAGVHGRPALQYVGFVAVERCRSPNLARQAVGECFCKWLSLAVTSGDATLQPDPAVQTVRKCKYQAMP